MLNDTIGFIRDLPPKLIKSFSSTLEDSIESDLLLHVIDANDPFVEERIEVVHQVLSDIGANQEKILVFNKIDLLNEEKKAELAERFTHFNPVFLSVKEGEGIETLKTALIEKLQ